MKINLKSLRVPKKVRYIPPTDTIKEIIADIGCDRKKVIIGLAIRIAACFKCAYMREIAVSASAASQ